MSASRESSDSEPARRASRREFHEWLTRRPGSLILDAERAHLDRILPDLFGYHLVQVGRLADANLLSKSRILGRVVVELDADPGPFRHPVVHGRPSALPFESDGVDVVVMPHVLEFEAEPHEAVREASRVLVPEGHLVMTGFNPWSLFGAWRLALRSRGSPPWCGRFISPSRLKDWLALLGFDLLEMGTHFRRPPLRSQRLLNRFSFLDHDAMPLSSALGAAYVVLAKKRVTTLTRVRPRWRPRRRLAVVGLAGPSRDVSPISRCGRESAATGGADACRPRCTLTRIRLAPADIFAPEASESRQNTAAGASNVRQRLRLG